MAETKPGTPPVRARIGNTGEDGRRQPAPCLSHHPRDEELPINHLEVQMLCHSGYEAHRNSFDDVWALSRRFGILVPDAYRGPRESYGPRDA